MNFNNKIYEIIDHLISNYPILKQYLNSDNLFLKTYYSDIIKIIYDNNDHLLSFYIYEKLISIIENKSPKKNITEEISESESNYSYDSEDLIKSLYPANDLLKIF